MQEKVAAERRYHTFILLMLSGGFMGAYSYYLKGGVFANAETANLLIFAMHISQGSFTDAAKVLVPISTFFIGTFFSEMFKDKLKHRWPSLLIFSEIILLAFLALLPENAPFTIFHVMIALISSMQYNTFREARGVQLSTLFCTAHLRGGGSCLYNAVRTKDRTAYKKAFYHIGMILTFIAGAMLCSFSSRMLMSRTIALAIIPLFFVLIEVQKDRKNSGKHGRQPNTDNS